MTIQHVTVAGGGVLGSQIAFQTAFKGYNVTLYDINEKAVKHAQLLISQLQPSYEHDLQVTVDDFQTAMSRMTFSTDLADATKDADLIIEAIPEKISIKQSFYKELSQVAPKDAIFASNSSTLLPSDIAPATGRPTRFLNLHFANQIWLRNTAEVMGSPETDPAVFNTVVDFAKSIGMIAIPLQKEQPGYVLNSILVPWLNAALKLWANGIATPETIDKTWMVALSSPIGPFGILDMIGLRTHYNIVVTEAERTGDADLKHAADKMKERIDANLLGPSTGEGFYHYPKPEFMNPDFLK